MWLARDESLLPSRGRFDLTYDLRLEARVERGAPYAVMVGSHRPEVVPSRGGCVEYVAGEGEGRPVHP